MKISKKLLVSMGIVTLTVAVAVGGTISYFSDTETSSGNTFTAGAIDLQVDSWGHYNGYQCVGGLWQTCTPGGEVLLKNGSFEEPVVNTSQDWDVFSGSQTGWTVEWVNDDVTSIGDYDRPEPALQEFHSGIFGDAPDGNQYAELDSDWDGPGGGLSNEPALIKISQEIPTEVGKMYELSYWFSPRPDTTAANNQMEVYVGGNLVATNGEAGGATTNWVQFKKIFVAESVSTKVEFKGVGTDDSYGIFLDDVRVYGMECTPSTEFTQSCSSTWNLTDLGPTNQFFNFGDIKPGDYGENTISLHVDNNDAYACMTFSGLVDLENTRNDPELDAGDVTEEVGELSDYVYMYAWEDDGNNIWEDGERPFWQDPMKASVLDGDVLTLAAPGNGTPFVGGDTRYIGLAWCAGTMTVDSASHEISCDGESMGNITQTDSVLLDVSFYVEQVRNNGDFTCSKLLPAQVER